MSGPKVTLRTQPKFLAIIDQGQWLDLGNFSGAISATSGSGLASSGPRRAVMRSGSTAGSTASLRTDEEMAWSSGRAQDVVDWSKKVVLHIVFSPAQSTTNGVSRLTLGKDSAAGVGALGNEGLGIQIDELALKGIVHDGTTGATVDLSTTLTGNNACVVTVVSDGSGNVEWFLDGVSKGTSTGGPTGLAASGFDVLQSESDNGADAAQQELVVHDVKVYVEQ